MWMRGKCLYLPTVNYIMLDMKECEEQMMYTTTTSQSLQVGQDLNLVNSSDVLEGNMKEPKYGN